MADIELCIMSCLIIKPELMKEIYVEDKHFLKHKRMWQFMKTYYEKFGNFDINIMHTVCKDKWHIINYIEELISVEAYTCYFNQYQDRLIEIYNETQKDNYIIEKVYDEALKLLVRKTSTNGFKDEVLKIYEDAEKIFNGGNME